jgi:hypothetical protein
MTPKPLFDLLFVGTNQEESQQSPRLRVHTIPGECWDDVAFHLLDVM